MEFPKRFNYFLSIRINLSFYNAALFGLSFVVAYLFVYLFWQFVSIILMVSMYEFFRV